MSDLSRHALAIWNAALDAVRPETLLQRGMDQTAGLREVLARARRILVVGAGKAGAAMSAALESALGEHLDRVEGIVNVPANVVRPLRRIQLHAARPAGSNFPTAEGVAGSERMLALFGSAGPEDLGLCLLSGGGSALLPAPDGVSLEEKLAITRQLHACGATIHEMNAVRKHLSRIKGGRLAQAFTGRELFSLIISDVVGDPLDVIASGPTAADPSTFADALEILHRYQLLEQAPARVRSHLEAGREGKIPETLKQLPGHAHNVLLGNNALALTAAQEHAEKLGYRVLNLGSFLEGESREVAAVAAGIVRSIRADGRPLNPPVCILIGGETTVTLPSDSGRGGRNQEFALAIAHRLGKQGLQEVAVLSGGTDGEDGPTDAAGALIDGQVWSRLESVGLKPVTHLARHDSYPVLDAIGALLRTGPTNTNVMDVRIVLVGPESS